MRTHFFLSNAALLGAFLLLTAYTPQVAAQRGAIQAEAIAGQPFGVAIVTLPPNGDTASAADTNNFAISERNGRAVYPVFTTGRVRRLLGELIGADLGNMPTSLSVAFLFTGDTPLQLTVYGPNPVEFEIVPRQQPPRQFERLLNQWWREYNNTAKQQLADGDYPPVVQTYLTNMLANRLRLETPFLSKAGENKPSETQQNLDLLLGTESLQAATMKETITRGSGLGATAVSPPPREIKWQRGVERPFAPAVAIEPIAMHVPENCFYIRFGKYSNHVWLSHLMDDYGGDIGSMVTLRGLKTEGDERVQRQLALKASVIGDLVGDALISDVAMVGRDLYFEEGAAMGMLFQARTNFLGNNFKNERQSALAEELKNGATMETVKIADRDVSFLSTPDNRLRSYYAVDGDYHFFSTSRAMIEDFYAAGAGQGALGQTSEFKHARTQMPISNDYTVFVYFSSAFFRSLASPQYQIELNRRMQSLTDMQLLQMAQLAARAEQRPAKTVDDLVVAGLLPRGFGKRADGSGPIVAQDRIVDSLRGPLGTFTPIPDVKITAVTQEEAATCERRAAFFESQWKQMDPIMVGVKRYLLDTKAPPGVKEGTPIPRVERIVIDGHVPLTDDGKYGKYLSMLGPPNKDRIAPDPNDIISIQAYLKGGGFSPSVPPHFMFAGVQDSAPLVDSRSTGIIKTLKLLKTTPGYLGAWPKSGLLDMLPLGLIGGQPDAWGYTQLLFGLSRRQWGDFSALSFDRRVLENVTPGLHPETTNSDAQVRIHVGDLANSQISTLVNSLYHDRARQASMGNVRFLHAISQQLQVPREEARDVAEKLLNAKLACTLGGEFELVAGRGGLGQWRTTKAVVGNSELLPNDYRAPILDWFRGLDASLIKFEDRLLVHAELDMQRKVGEAKIELPIFNFFGGDKKPEAKPAAPAGQKEVLPAPAGIKDPKKVRDF